MGTRFDKWLARPSTLLLLRQLIGPEPAAIQTKRPYRNGLPHGRAKRQSTTRSALTSMMEMDHKCKRPPSSAAVTASIETFYEQRERVAQELGLRIPQKHCGDHNFEGTGTAPSSTSYADLLYAEARVRDVSATRGLLIDEPVNHANIEAWVKILEYRERTDGFTGVLDVWRGMRERNIDLPVNGEQADALWTTFIRAAIVCEPDEIHQRLLHEVFTHAKDLKASGIGQYQPLHKIMVGRFLRLHPDGAGIVSDRKRHNSEYKWHRAICENGLCEARSLTSLVVDVAKSTNPGLAFARWQQLYLHDQAYFRDVQRELYDLCMPLVFTHVTNDPTLVVAWHNFLVTNNDVPGPDLLGTGPVRYLMGIYASGKRNKASPRARLDELTAILAEYRGESQPSALHILSRASMSGLVGDVHGIKPKAISDKFCARMFATQAFSLETSIRGLALLGTESLGPVALQELAIRAATSGVLKEKLAEVEDAGMSISSSAYAHILKTVVNQSQNDLFQILLASDQHPESYDDQHTQETLLATFIQTENWPLVHLTLIGLSQKRSSRVSRAWNTLLQHYIKARNLSEVARLYDHICAEKMILTSRSLNFMMKYSLATRGPGKAPTREAGFVSTSFVVNAHMYAVSQGQHLEADRWIELLKRYGMTNDMSGVERLIRWLIKRYPKWSDTSEWFRLDGVLQRIEDDKSRQATIFNPTMLRAIVIWGFRQAVVQNKLQSWSFTSSDEPKAPASWTCGLQLLLYLKQQGIGVQTDNVRRAVREILWPIFGPGVSKRRFNTRLLGRNETTIMEYISDANSVWDEPLFDISPNSSSVEYETAEARALHAVFGDQRLVDQKLGKWVDVGAWAAAKDEGLWQDAPLNSIHRRNTWEDNPFRFEDKFATRRQRQAANQKLTPSGRRSSVLSPPQNPRLAAQPSNWRPLPNQPDTREES